VQERRHGTDDAGAVVARDDEAGDGALLGAHAAQASEDSPCDRRTS
jgi:hypothetical protein